MVFLTWHLYYKRKKKSCSTLLVIQNFKVAPNMGKEGKSVPSHTFGHRMEVAPGLNLSYQQGLLVLCATSQDQEGQSWGTRHRGHPATLHKKPAAHPTGEGGGCKGGRAPAHQSLVPTNGTTCSGSRAVAFGAEGNG